jgi:hypothetical protein
MNLIVLSRTLLGVGAAATALAACGQAAAPHVSAMDPALREAARSQTWMLPEAKHEDLLYVSGLIGKDAVVFVFSYPAGKEVGRLDVFAAQLCSDPNGHVFMTQPSSTRSSSTIVEYAHGGTKPIATLHDPYIGVGGCSVDPADGDLAVTNNGGNGTVLIYPHAKDAKLKVYGLPFQTQYCGYDKASNLFTIGHTSAIAFAELPKNARSFKEIKLEKPINQPMGVQWDGRNITLGQGTNPQKGNNGLIRRYMIRGLDANWVGDVRVDSTAVGFAIMGSSLIVSTTANQVDFFNYPRGGQPTAQLSVTSPGGVTVSVAPKG